MAVTLNGYTYRSSVATVNGEPMIGGSAVRQASGVAGGDTVEVDVVIDTAPRTITVPDDLAAALDAEPEARATFDKLSYSNQRFWVEPIEGAKTPDTRLRRIEKAVATMRDRSRWRAPPYILRRSTRSRRLRITIDPEQGLVVTVPVADPPRLGPSRARMIDAFLREREPGSGAISTPGAPAGRARRPRRAGRRCIAAVPSASSTGCA